MNDRMIHGESNVWSTAHRQKKSIDLMFILDLDETINQLAMANSVCWYGHVLWREDGHVFRRVLDYDFEGHRRMGGQRGHRKSRSRNKV